MSMRSSHWTYAIDPGIRGAWEVAASRRELLRTVLFNVTTSDRASEELFGVGAIGIDAWDNYEASGAVSIAEFDQNYKKTFTHEEKLIKVHVERKLYDDNQFPQIFNMAARIGDSMGLKRESDAASVFNNAFSDTYAGADAVGLCSLVHPYSPHKSGSTQANEGTYALTDDNVATVREAMMAFTDDNGNKVGVTPNALLVPPGLEDEALIITGSDRDPNTGNNAMNPQSGRFQVYPWHYLTDSNAWFMLDTNLMRQSLYWFDRVSPYIKYQGLIDEVVAEWITYMRYSFGWTDWKWIYGNNPS